MAVATQSYEFVLARPDARFKDTCWYLKLAADQIPELHERVTQAAFWRWTKDPHNFKKGTQSHPQGLGEPRDEIVALHHPVLLGAGWLVSAEKLMWQDGVVYVNRCGGMLPHPPEVIEATIAKDTLEFPEEDADIITISQWPSGNHWYIGTSSSHSGRLFEGKKFPTIQAAEEYAKGVAPDAIIKVKPKYV